MTEEIRYIANLQRQEEFDNEVTELKDALKRLEQENKELKISNSNLDNQLHRTNEMMSNCNNRLQKYRSALEEIRTYLNTLSSIDSDFTNTETYLRIQTEINEVINPS